MAADELTYCYFEQGWQAFIATTSFGAGYTILLCASLAMDYEIQSWYDARSIMSLKPFIDTLQACDTDDHFRCTGRNRLQHFRGAQTPNVRGDDLVSAHLPLVWRE